MHAWQDSYVHWDRGYRWWTGGHAKDDTKPDQKDDPWNVEHRAYERCDFATRELEKLWFKYNIEDWMENPNAELPMQNPWFSMLPYVYLPKEEY
jgi:hypothetical protein